MNIRVYKPTDCEDLANLFYLTVHTVNAKDYSNEQLNAWATGKIDLEEWNKSLSAHYTVLNLMVEGTTMSKKSLTYASL